MITRNIYDIPYPETIPTDLAGAKIFFDEILLPFFAEKTGLVVRTDLNVMAPDYATNCYVCFLAPSAEADPYFAVVAKTVNNLANVWFIAPLNKNGNIFQPSIYSQGASSQSWTYGECIILQGSNFNVQKSYLISVDFNDGRKAFCFRTQRIDNSSHVESNRQGAIYIGPIRMKGNRITTCVVMAQGMNSAWLNEYDQRACSSIESVGIGWGTGSYGRSNLVGTMYNGNQGKRVLMGFDFCIGEDAYILNTYYYSDVLNEVYTGSVLTIDDKKYLCIRKGEYNDWMRLLIPEEVN